MRIVSLVSGIAAAAMTACGNFGPRSDLPRGAYVLESVGGSALPFTLRDDAEAGRWVLHADTLLVLGGGKAENRRVIEVTGSTLQRDSVRHSIRQTEYRLVDGQLEVGSFDCPMYVSCTQFKMGEIIPGGFCLPVGLVTFSAMGVYRRAP
jgi:hypothetical protein